MNVVLDLRACMCTNCTSLVHERTVLVHLTSFLQVHIHACKTERTQYAFVFAFVVLLESITDIEDR